MTRLRVTEAQAARFQKRKPRPSTSASLEAYQREHPGDCDPTFPGQVDSHHVERSCPCPMCGTPTTHFVQLRGLQGPLSVTLPMCVECAKVEQTAARRKRR